MDTNSNNNENYLSDWLADKLTDQQLRAIVGESEFVAYERLKNSIGRLQVEDPDLARNYAAIKQKRIDKFKPEVRPTMSLYHYAAIAATLLLFFGMFQFFVFSNHVETAVGKPMLLAMSDGSKVRVNANSRLEYPSLFKYNRKVCLEGEAFFEVEKGGSFKVETSIGTVEVLGTKFNVFARGSYFEVVCYEGRVKVVLNDKSEILENGQAIRLYKGNKETWIEDDVQPHWLSGESSFLHAPLGQVLAQLESQFGHQVQYPKSLEHIRFTGSFTHSDLDISLKTICIPLNLKYQIAEGKIIISE